MLLRLLRACAELPMLLTRHGSLLKLQAVLLRRLLVLRLLLRMGRLLWQETQMRQRHALLLLGRWWQALLLLLLLLLLLWRVLHGSGTNTGLKTCRRRRLHAEAGLRPSGSRREAGLRVQGRHLIWSSGRLLLLDWRLCAHSARR